jgi:hypothetical protein
MALGSAERMREPMPAARMMAVVMRRGYAKQAGNARLTHALQTT